MTPIQATNVAAELSDTNYMELYWGACSWFLSIILWQLSITSDDTTDDAGKCEKNCPR